MKVRRRPLTQMAKFTHLIPDEKKMSGVILYCQVCGSDNLSSFYQAKHPGLKICNKCSFVFFERIPTQEELIRHYKTYSRNDSISEITLKRFDEIIASFEPYRKNGRILDVGCGNGHLLYRAKLKGWDVYGTEFTDEAMAVCRAKGIHMQQGLLNTDNYSRGEFDVICFIEVIEHIQNASAELKKFNILLRQGGLLYITTPNFNALSGKMAGPDWNIIEYPEHLTYFRPSNLDRLLTGNGFERVSLKTTGFSYNRVYQSKKHHRIDSGVDEALRDKAENKIIFKAMKKSVNFLLNTFRWGDTIKAIYRRK